ncbi:LysR family transcriptional regulator [Pseudonocardiaceae bacterium YIM PH 21723]|nr:LysR family transcriptional regulator [Pseudonocardiaceae bacterium YIM PH 21723]
MPDLELRHLRAVCAVADTGSVSKAASQLGLTQPALTAQLRRLERLVGGQLFIRTASGSSATELGRHVVGTARHILGDLDHLLVVAQQRARGNDPRSVVVGSTPVLFIGELVSELGRRIPGFEIRAEIEPSGVELLARLLASRVHIAVFERFEGLDRYELRGVEIRSLLTEPRFVAVPADSALAGDGPVDLGRLADFEWVVPPPEHDSGRLQLHTACMSVGFTPKIRHHTTERSLIRHLVAAGAVATVPPCTPSGEGIVVLPLLDDPLRMQIMVVCRTDGALSGRTHEAFGSVAQAYHSLVEANPAYAKWWRDNPRAHAELDAALLIGDDR